MAEKITKEQRLRSLNEYAKAIAPQLGAMYRLQRPVSMLESAALDGVARRMTRSAAR